MLNKQLFLLLSSISILFCAAPAVWAEALIKVNSEQLPVETQIVDNNSSLEQKLRTQLRQEVLTNSSIDPTLSAQSDLNSTQETIEQVTSVSQLSDVQPTDWAFQALQSLVERYGVIAGYPDGTYRGNRSMTRYEFAAGLNAALDRISELIASGTANTVKREDLETLQRLQQEFATELASVRGRVDNLEAQVAELESNKFTSSTTILGGEVVVAVSQAFGGGPPGTGESNTILTHLTRLQTVSTFTGKDRLRLELAAGNFDGLGFANRDIFNTNAALLSFQTATDNQIQLSTLEYRFAAFGDRAVFTIRPVGFSLSSVLTANSPYFDAGRGAISRFGEAPPIFKIGNLDAGIGADFLVSRNTRIQLAYGANNANNPDNGFVFGRRSHAAAAQLLFTPAPSVLTGLSYVYGYSPDGRLNTFTGSAIADASGFINQSSNIHALSGTLQWRLTPQLTFATWGGIVGTYAAQTDAFAVSTNYLFSLGYSDPFGREGDLFAVLFGQPPKLIDIGDTSASTGLADEATSLHLEAFYRLLVNDNISITPGFFLVTNPGNIDNNNTIYVGTIRTTFRF
ncbi:iron uptake porin [Synechocystis sp. PCC 7509]|uniref:iron uptake porin n=1 Tax=Synechocystis sp. PCC 7509 TaxID=927677 RepID=UPI0002AC9D45|nr:iron uptake porin [Synechocystis sp. PCC 7509]